MMVNAIRAGALALAVASGAFSAAQAADYPSRAVTIVVPFAPGGATDAIARVVGAELSQRWKQPVVIENRPGAGGNIAAELAARARPDGYTLFLGTIATNAINESLYRKLGFNPEHDFVAVAPLAGLPLVLVTSSESKIRSVGDLVDLAKASPGRVTYASPGTGTALHLAGEIFQRLAGVKLTHVAYKGSAPALSDVLAGRVDVMFDTVVSSAPHIAAGKLRALAVTTADSVPSLPSVLPLARQGLPGFDVSAWNGLFAPRGTPPQIVRLVGTAVSDILADKTVQGKVSAMGAIVMKGSQDDFSAFVAAETGKYRKLIQDANIVVN